MAGPSTGRLMPLLLLAFFLPSIVHSAAVHNVHHRMLPSRSHHRRAPSPSYTPPNITFSPVNGSSSIQDSSYHRLTGLLPTVLENAVESSFHSWEIGTLVEAILETYYPSTRAFGYDPNYLNGKVPTEALQVVVAALGSYPWSGSPESTALNTSSADLSDYLSPSSAPVTLAPQALVNGDGSLGDPCSLGAGVWTLAEFLTQQAASQSLSTGNEGADDYAWAVGNQLQYLRQQPTSSNGTMSQRENGFQLWADMGYMIPPFLASLGLATSSDDLLALGINQWLLESSALLDTTKDIFRHINDFDARLWATGNAWMLYGACRVLASIGVAGETSNLAAQVGSTVRQLSAIFPAIFAQLDSDNLVPNYMYESEPSLSIGDAAGTALIVAAYYRFAALAPRYATQTLTAQANKAFDGVIAQLGDDGWLTHVVDPMGTNGWVVNLNSGQRSPEGQSFLAHMWVARTALGV
ncbi:hypothetical protein BD324DRAFT_619871 [Kockovaella imperatae]|uniref:Six-hairpin glycosidase-like protein n=1 Tax=Kockovaella imperatae TaxID=4999 RepID=A0A1Y1UJM4_9TREE|nr:hypothetical protein BD324DRAFT_619871 [Kockovaella imperatae]ORX38179.1 hypothetical protein BD324DRAFT_619871 [Kockovaella imperatae]